MYNIYYRPKISKIIIFFIFNILGSLLYPNHIFAVVTNGCLTGIHDDDVIISSQACNIPSDSTYIIDKAISESSTSNPGILQLNGGSLTIMNRATLQVGSLLPSGGTITIQDGGSIIIGGVNSGLWVTDADADGYAFNFTTYTASATGRRRLGLMKSKSSADCNDSNITLSRTIDPAKYLDSDGDTYGVGSLVSCAPQTGNYTASNNTDCDDTTTTYHTRKITGGTITSSGGYKIHTFTSSGSLVVTCPTSLSVDALIVAGGGGSGGALATSRRCGGGGGAGGVLNPTNISISNTTYPITIGAGGTAGGWGLDGGDGGNSIFSAYTAIGGGGGGYGFDTGAVGREGHNGGSGGGDGGMEPQFSTIGGTGTSGQGYAGGRATSTQYGGAGGSAGGAASYYTPGPGFVTSISGTSQTYGVGGSTNSMAGAVNGTPNTGNGGGTVYDTATTHPRTGGSGIVIIRYLDP